jgi:hypothetical protein
VTSSGFTANWNSVEFSTNFYLDVSTSSSFSSFVSGYNNLSVGNVTSYAVSGLSASTTYYYRVRVVVSGVTSANSNTESQETSASGPTSCKVAYETVGAVSEAHATSVSPALPSGWAAGDIFVLLANVDHPTVTISVSAGWSPLISQAVVASNSTIGAWYRVAVSGDAAPTVSWGSTAYAGSALIFNLRNAKTTTVPDVAGSWNQQASSGDVVESSAVTTNVNYDLCCFIAISSAYSSSQTWSSTSNSGGATMTNQFTASSSSGAVIFALWTFVQATAGSTGTCTSTSSGVVYGNWLSAIVGFLTT